MASAPISVQYPRASISAANNYLELFPTSSGLPDHGDVLIDSIAAQLTGTDLSGITSIYLSYFPLPAPQGQNAPQFDFPLSFSFWKVAGLGDFISITHKVDCYCPAQTVAILRVDWPGNSNPPGISAPLNVVMTYRDVAGIALEETL